MEQDRGSPNESSGTVETDWIQIDEHVFRLVPPDIIIARSRGDFTLEQARFVFKTILSWPRPEKGFFYLSNITHLRHQSQQVVSEAKTLPPGFFRAVAVIGASFRHRVLVDAILRAARYFQINLMAHSTRYLDTEDEAYAWFERLRRGED
jgi:hypothetical protein